MKAPWRSSSCRRCAADARAGRCSSGQRSKWRGDPGYGRAGRPAGRGSEDKAPSVDARLGGGEASRSCVSRCTRSVPSRPGEAVVGSAALRPAVAVAGALRGAGRRCGRRDAVRRSAPRRASRPRCRTRRGDDARDPPGRPPARCGATPSISAGELRRGVGVDRAVAAQRRPPSAQHRGGRASDASTPARRPGACASHGALPGHEALKPFDHLRGSRHEAGSRHRRPAGLHGRDDQRTLPQSR
jgi:hypothetical protein